MAAFANLSAALLPARGAPPGAAPRLVWTPTDYSRQALSLDPSARAKAGAALAAVAAALEAGAGGVPQDVEGCFDGDGNVVVVQTRPQPGATASSKAA